MKYSILFLCVVGLFSLMVLVHEGIHLFQYREIKDKK